MNKPGCLLCLLPTLLAQDARQIVQESQNRGRANSQRYEGVAGSPSPLTQVSRKSWISDRWALMATAKAIIRFIEPAEVKGVALLVVNHPDRSSDQWMWTPAIGRDRRIALQDRSTRFFGTDFSSRIWKSATRTSTTTGNGGRRAIDARAAGASKPPRAESKTSQSHTDPHVIRKDNYVAVQYES